MNNAFQDSNLVAECVKHFDCTAETTDESLDGFRYSSCQWLIGTAFVPLMFLAAS